MAAFHSIKELINLLNLGKELLSEMFEKRRALTYKHDDALHILEEERIEALNIRGIIRQNGQNLEIEDTFLQFFEQVLEVNEEINISYIHEHIRQVKENILYYQQENSEHRKYLYIKAVKNILRKIGKVTIRNIIDLKRNIENTFKTEPNYKIKITKLENYDRKRLDIKNLIEHTERLIAEEEQIFFKAALDEELKMIIIRLRQQLIESGHNLVEMERQIIEYLNQIKYQSGIIEKIRQIKYLKDQIELKSKTNFIELLSANRDVFFQPKPAYPLKLSLDMLQSDFAHEIIRKTARRYRGTSKPVMPMAESISTDYLETQTENEVFINLEELRNSFLASGNHLFDFIMNYAFQREADFEERVTLFCQVVSLYENDLNITEKYVNQQNVEFVLVYPK
jgi:hypothetical protein